MTDTPPDQPEGLDPRAEIAPAFLEPYALPAPPRAGDAYAHVVGQALAEYPHERILRFDVILTIMPTQAGLMAAAVVYIEAATMVIGSVMGLMSQPIEPPKLLNEPFVKILVGDLVQGIRDTRAQESAGANGGGGTIDLTGFHPQG